jgi:hypothetical protein
MIVVVLYSTQTEATELYCINNLYSRSTVLGKTPHSKFEALATARLDGYEIQHDDFMSNWSSWKLSNRKSVSPV